VSGGAYGGFCNFDSHSGMFTYLSYRDPNLLGTLDNYDGTGGTYGPAPTPALTSPPLGKPQREPLTGLYILQLNSGPVGGLSTLDSSTHYARQPRSRERSHWASARKLDRAH